MKEDIVCYCQNVDRATIKDAIENRHARTIEDIKWSTGACNSDHCKEKHPKGICCVDEVKQMIIDFRGEVCETGPTCSCCS